MYINKRPNQTNHIQAKSNYKYLNKNFSSTYKSSIPKINNKLLEESINFDEIYFEEAIISFESSHTDTDKSFF